MKHMAITRTPWERRLEDLSRTLISCGASYFNPDLFRQNVNNFLQTSRTVTFIIQKNKSSIKGFDTWYKNAVVSPWECDAVMQWAKNARNTVEKEGDLVLHSSLDVSLLTSYLKEEDIKLECGREELLNATVDRLVKLAQIKLPTGVRQASAIKIERTWITSSLSSHELLWGLGYVYAKLYNCVESLADHLSRDVPDSIPRPSDVSALREDSRQVQFVKLKDMHSYRIRTKQARSCALNELPDFVVKSLEMIKSEVAMPCDFTTTMEYYSRMAEMTFEQWGNHVPMLFLLGDNWAPLDMITFIPEDQAEKYFFWRAIGERIALQGINAIVFTSESWLRRVKGYPQRSIKDLPIIGEKLQVSGFDRSSNIAVYSWNIMHPEGSQPILGPREDAYQETDQPFFLVPAMRGMGHEPEFMKGASSVDC